MISAPFAVIKPRIIPREGTSIKVTGKFPQKDCKVPKINFNHKVHKGLHKVRKELNGFVTTLKSMS